MFNFNIDLTLTINKLTKLFEPVRDPDRVGSLQRQTIGQFLGLPLSIRKEIKATYRNPSQWKMAYLDMYTHHHPCPSWKRISETLRQCDLHQRADEVEYTYVQGIYVHIACTILMYVDNIHPCSGISMHGLP